MKVEMSEEELEIQNKKIYQLDKLNSKLEWIIILMSIYSGFIMFILISILKKGI